MPLDDADKKFITDLIASSLKTNNETLGKQFVTADAAQKMVGQGLEKGLKDAGLDKVGETLQGITNKLEGLGKDGGKDGGGKGDPDPAVVKLQRQLEELQQRNQQAEQARKDAENRSRRSAMHNQVRAELAKLGIPADRHDLVLPVLEAMKAGDGEPVLRFNDAGEPVFVAQRNGYTDTLAIADGIAEWGKTEVAKVYLPPAGQGGTGGGAGGTGGTGRTSTAPRDEKGNVDFKALGSKLKLGSVDVADA